MKDDKHDGIGDTLRVLADHGDHVHALRERNGQVIGTGVAVHAKSAADLTPGMEYAEKRTDGTYRITGRIPGPPKVNSREYRTGWDRIFGGKPEVGSA